MAGIFLSYSRADREHAYRIVQGLRALGVHVWWDEDMPGVDWQYELEQRITDMAAVLVLWSKNSRKSNNVRDEARLADKKNKLINALVGLEEPPHPFDRNNGLPIDGWDGREPHRGWGRLVQTAESFIVGAGAAEPGTFMAELAKVEQDWQDRKQALALAQEAFGDAQAAVTDAQAVCAAATAELSDAHKQLGQVGEMGFSIQVLAAAKEVCDAKAVLVAEADAAHRTARAKLAEASRKLKRCMSALQEPVRELPAEPITPIPPKPKPPEPVSPTVEERLADKERRAEAQRQIEAEKLERERLEREKLEEEDKARAEADRIEQEKRDAEAEQARLDALAEAERKAEADRIEQARLDVEQLERDRIEREQKDTEAARQAEIARKQAEERASRFRESEARAKRLRLEADARAQRQQVRHEKRQRLLKGTLTTRNAIISTVVLAGAIGLFTIRQPHAVGEAPPKPASEAPPATASEADPPIPFPGDWLIGVWVINQKDVCEPLLRIARGKGTNELTFAVGNRKNEFSIAIPKHKTFNAPDTFTIESDGTLLTSSWRYRRLQTGTIQRQKIDDPENVQELTACKN